MADLIQIRGDTAANWTTHNPTLSEREIGLETDTFRAKVGDGATAWADLPYYTAAPVNQQSGTAYTLALSDSCGIVEMENEAANEVTIPAGLDMAPGTVVVIVQTGAGATTISVAESTMSLNGAAMGSVTISERWASVSVYPRDADANEWVAIGNHGGAS